MIQGQGGGTLDKERKIGSAETIGMTIANGLARRHAWRQAKPYFHLDLNAGSGWNEIAGCPGSPVVFCELAQRKLTAMPLYAWFCDINQASVEQMERWLVRYGHLPQPGISLFCEDNRSVISRFAEQICRRDRPEHALGSLLCDPNAWFYRAKNGNGVPVEEIIAFARLFPKIDIILNVNYRFYAMAAHATNGGFDALLSPDQIRSLLNRSHWLVSRQHFGGRDRFWLAIGRNVITGDHRRLGLVHWDSPEGRSIMNIVAGGRQGDLDLEAPRARREPQLALPLPTRQRGAA
jgi:hypothetical protein